MNDAAKAAPQPIQTTAEAENLIHHLLTAMDALVATVEQETELVRAGRNRADGVDTRVVGDSADAAAGDHDSCRGYG